MGFLLCCKLIVDQGVLTGNPLYLVTLRVDEQVAVAPADAAVAHFHRDVVSRLPSQHLVLDAEPDSSTVASARLQHLGHGIVVETPDDGVCLLLLLRLLWCRGLGYARHT